MNMTTAARQPIPRPLTAVERECKRLCDDAGALFVGIQSGYGVTQDVMLFQLAPGMATTLGLRLSEVTPRRIREKMMELALKEAASHATFDDAVKVICAMEERKQHRRAAGFSLIEMMAVLFISVTMMAMAATQGIQIRNLSAEQSAKRRAKVVWETIGTYGVCQYLTPGPACNGLAARIPAPNVVVPDGLYSWKLTGDPAGAFVYTGTPKVPGPHLVTIDNLGNLTVGGGS